MRTSEKGLAFIKQHEGLSLEAYKDIAGVLTIGYGHTGADVFVGQRIALDQAHDLLVEDVREAEDAINRLVKKPLKQNQFDALVSFVFNVGAGAFNRSTALKRLNAGDYVGAAEALTWWNKARVDGELRPVRGLIRRRAAEKELFLRPQTFKGVRENTARAVPASENRPRRWRGCFV